MAFLELFLTEGVVFHEELGNVKKDKTKMCATSVHPENCYWFFTDLAKLIFDFLRPLWVYATFTFKVETE